MRFASTTAPALLALTAAVTPAIAMPTDAQPAEPYLSNITQLTSPRVYKRAGEAYFSPDGRWIIFQAEEVDASDEPPRYAMYVAPLEFGAEGSVTGLGDPIRLSGSGAATTCGWFHPTLPGVVLYGSTITAPASAQAAGYSRGTSRYTWDFPTEMEIVTQTVPAIVSDLVKNETLRAELMARPDLDTPTVFWEREGYDAEGSWSPDGRSILFTAVDPETGDGDLFIRDIASGTNTPLVVADGYDGGPFFSPDGTRICYRSDREGNNLLQLFVADLVFDDRGIPVAIENETRLTEGDHVNWAPYWHPSGDWLVYATSNVSHRNYEVFAIPANLNADGSMPEPVRITYADGFDGLPVFSRDGSKMMWTGQRGQPGATGRPTSQLYIADVSGTPAGLDLPVSSGAAPTISQALSVATEAERRYHEHTTILASDWLAGRFPGTPEIEIAEHYIQRRFSEAGLEPAFSDSFFQTFSFALHGTDQILEGRNVGGVIPGKGDLADRWIIIGAHHDHLGMGAMGSMKGEGEIHEGADDNASGTSAVLMLAQMLSDAYAEMPDGADARSVLIVTFSGEELGLNGSRSFVKDPPIDLAQCDFMLNYDMIGRITGDRVSVSGLASGVGLADIVAQPLGSTALNVVIPDGLSSRSDHAAFYDEEVPVAFMTIDPFHTDYHTPEDEAWKLNVRAAVQAIKLGEDMVLAVARHPEPIAFEQVEAYDTGPNIGVGGLKVRFGIMPGNYNDTEPGVVVQRVSPDGSADLGGVKDDDRLIEWNGTQIGSISDWMELMAEHQPGEVVTVTVLRGGERVDLQIELQASRSAD